MMVTWKEFWKKVRRHWMRLRLQPIRVFCFHQVSDEFEPEGMWECDWTQTEVFKRNILALKRKYTFVPLEEAYRHISNDRIRFKKYAALTADDGWASLKNILPWLAQVPVTFFLNPLYMDGVHYQSRETEKFLTRDEVAALVSQYEPFITIASHGWLHKDCHGMVEEEFLANVEWAETSLQSMHGKIPFYAFTFGRRTVRQMEILRQKSLIPVLMDGGVNYNDEKCIHRELLDGALF